MVSLHWPNILQTSLISSSWVLQVTAGISVIAHEMMDMVWMIFSSGVR